MSSKKLCTGFENTLGVSRRKILQTMGGGLGSIALSNLIAKDLLSPSSLGLNNGGLHHKPTAKRVIYLFQSGAPSQLDLFDYKPRLTKEEGKDLPDSVRKGQRLTGMSGSQSTLPLLGTISKFKRRGDSGQYISDLLPYTGGIVDDISIIRSMHTEAINHGPGVTMMETGSQFPGRPSLGSWVSYGLGTDNENLPSFIVLISKNSQGQPLLSRFWGNGFLPGKFAGVRFRSSKDAVVYLNSPPGIDYRSRGKMLDKLREIHEYQLEKSPDRNLETRIAQYEMAFKMQASIPEVTQIGNESDHTYKMYGEDSKTPGTYAANCLLARKLAEKGVKFIQLFHRGWDQHGNLRGKLPQQTKATDQASAALVKDLKQRGLLDDTLIVWGGEFGRTNYAQFDGGNQDNAGRDHHPKCFSMWLAGGGIKPGVSYGETDEYGYNVVKDGVHVHDLNATILHCLGINHERLIYKYQGRDFRLTDVEGKITKKILS